MMRFDNKQLGIWAVVACLALLTPAAASALGVRAPAPAPAPAPEPEPAPQSDPPETEEERERNTRRFDVRLRIAAEADDNAFNLRDDLVDEFDELPADRFLIDSVDDNRLVPDVTLSWSTTPPDRRSLRLGFSARAYRHETNQIQDYERYRIYIQKDLSDLREDYRGLRLQRRELEPRIFQTRRQFLTSNRSRVRVGYYQIVDRYTGEKVDDDAPEQTDISVPVRRSAIYDSEAWELYYQQRLNRGATNRFLAHLRYIHEERDYNVRFDERDSDRDRLAIGLGLFRLQQTYFWQLEGIYEYAEVSSNTALIGASNAVGGTVQDDLASERDTIRVNLAFYWFQERGGTPMRKRNELEFGVAFGAQDYVTGNRLDLTHFGRSDDLVQARVSYTQPVADNLSLDFFAAWAEVSTDLPGRAVQDFNEFVFGIAVNIFGGWRSR